MWQQIADGNTIGELGSEGTIILDEEYKERCCITLEKTDECYAITCAIYGTLVHTTFASETDYLIKYDAMKKDLAEFIDHDVHYPESERFCDEFTAKY